MTAEDGLVEYRLVRMLAYRTLKARWAGPLGSGLRWLGSGAHL